MRLALAAAALLVATHTTHGARLEITRLRGGAAWGHCSVERLGETRPATACAAIRLVASGKDIVVPRSRTLEVVLDATAAKGAVHLVAEVFTYAAPPTETIASTTLKDFERLVKQGTHDRFLERGLMHDAAMRAAPQAPLDAPALPTRLQLRFGGDDVGRKVVYAVWGWPALAPPDLHVELEPTAVGAGDGLQVSFGVQEPGWGPGSPPVLFVVSARPEGAAPVPLWSRRLDPARRAADRGWVDAPVDLRTVAGPSVTIVLEARVEGAAATFPVWAQPVLVHATPTPGGRPNVLLVSLDTVRADHLPSWGYGRATTPALDAFAAGGVRFEQAIAPFPSTTASHMSMLTGLYPCAHRVTVPSVTLAAGVTTLAEVLAGAGYATGAVTEDGLIKGDSGFNRGFDAYRDQVWTGDEPLGLFPDTIEIARTWLAGHAEEPFFFFLHTYQPHVPFKVPPYYKGLFVTPPDAPDAIVQGAAYDAGLRYTDDFLASLLGWLDRTGLLERTLVIVTSDHGTELGEHGGIGHARSVYEEQIHVPLV
ncbi:MAG: sulfatase, partial [Candidatus Binatia bacterium]